MKIIHSVGQDHVISASSVVIPGKCVVRIDRREVQSLTTGEITRIEPRLATLLAILYENRGSILPVSELARLQYGESDSALRTNLSKDIPKLRAAIGDREQSIIVNTVGLGYELVLPEEESDRGLTLKNVFSLLCRTEHLSAVCFRSRGNGLTVIPAEQASAEAVLAFLLPPEAFPQPPEEAVCRGLISGGDGDCAPVLGQFYSSAALLFDPIWTAGLQHVRQRLLDAKKRVQFLALRGEEPRLASDLEEYPLDGRRVTGEMLGRLAPALNEALQRPPLPRVWFGGQLPAVTGETADAAITALCFLALCEAGRNLRTGTVPAARERFRQRLNRQLRQLFLPPEEPSACTAAQADDFVRAALEEVRLRISQYLEGLDEEALCGIDKVFSEQYIIGAEVANRPAAEKGGVRETQPPAKTL